MSDIKLSENQKLAVNTRGKNILISAAAGSGKTFVLVQRILKLITQDNIDIDKLLVVTFTQAAANEMRERIGKAINDELLKNPYDQNLQRQAILLNKASISTIDAFCGSVVRNNFYKTNIDPGYRIVTNSAEINNMQQQAIDQLFNDKYEKNDQSFINLANAYCKDYNDDALSSIIIDIYYKAFDSPYPIKWLQMCKDNYNIDKFGDFYNTPFGIELSKIISEYYMKAYTIIQEVLKTMTVEQLNEIHPEVLEFLDEYKAFSNLSELISDTIYVLSTDDNAILIETALSHINNAKELYVSSENMNEILGSQKPYVDTLVDLVIEFSKIYQDIKLDKRVAEFNDILHYAHNLLREENGEPTSIADSLKEKYCEIIIDEYQDSNDLQESILTSFSRGNNLFMVGDIKQSIYRFRQANPDLFKKKYYQYPKEDNSMLIQLSDNYRSKSCVIDFCNFIFSQIMTIDFGDVDYNEDVALKSKDENPEIYNKTEIHILEKIQQLSDDLAGLTNVEYEADYIASQVERILSEDDKINPEDIAILTREKKNTFYPLLNSLARKGINAVAENNSSFNATLEIQTVIALLKIINNPYDNIPLITVLHSHIYNFSNDDLITIKKSYDSKLFYTCIKEYTENYNDDISERLRGFIDEISKYREFSNNNTLSRLLSFLYDESGYYTYVNLLPNGRQRQANLTMLNELAETFESYNSNDIGAFINHIEKSDDINEAVASDGQKSAVRIVTLHSSKGLEYPIVILGFTGTKVNKRKLYPIIHPKYGFALKQYKEQYYMLDTPLGDLYKTLLKKEDMSEALRLLYVGLTRAKERLIITGVSPLKQFDDYKDIYDRNPITLCYSDDHYLSWIMYCINNKFDGATITYIPWDESTLNNDRYKEEMLDLSNRIKSINTDINYSDQTDLIHNELDYVYHNAKAQQMPNTISISEIKRINSHINDTESDNMFENVVFDYPEFLSTKEIELNGAKRGTIYHSIFEYIDFYNTDTIEDIKNTVSAMVDKNIISLEESKVIDINKIYSFLKSDLFTRIKKSDEIYKETKFMMSMKGNEIYGAEFDDVDNDIIVRGIIDLYFVEDDHIILVDYKTDYIKNHNLSILKDKYKIQMDLYKKALEQNTHMPVTECIIYSIYENQELKL